MGCGLWGGVGLLLCRARGGMGRGGGFGEGAPSLLLTWNRQTGGGCPPRGAEGLNLGQEAGVGDGLDLLPLARRQVPHPKCWPQVFSGPWRSGMGRTAPTGWGRGNTPGLWGAGVRPGQ